MRRVRFCTFLTGLLLAAPLFAADGWQAIQQQAKGQTVWFNAWGGDPAVNRYLEWVSGEMQTHYAITLKIVPLADAADAVKRIQTEAAAGRKTSGSVDLLWVNGENFRTLKRQTCCRPDGRRRCPTGAMLIPASPSRRILLSPQTARNRRGAARS